MQEATEKLDENPDSQAEESKGKRKRRRRKKGVEKNDDLETLRSDSPLKNGGKCVSTSDTLLRGSEVICEVNNDQAPLTTATGQDGEVVGQPTDTPAAMENSWEACSNGVKIDKECSKTSLFV